jgi:hypothetical protein
MQIVACPKCNGALNENVINSSSLTECNSCGVQLRADIFPAVYKAPETGLSAEAVTAGTEAGCFYHPKKRAVSHCEICGRFLCALCDLEINDQHLCSACLEIGQKKKKFTNLENHRILYDKIALFLSIVPFSLILWFVSIITAPAAIFVVIRYWKAPAGILSGNKIRFVLALILAGIQVVGWTMFIVSIYG